MDKDKSWFYNARTAYWNVLNPGIKFGTIFNMKNNNVGIEGGKAGFIARVNVKCGDMLTSQIFDEIKQGIFRSDEYKEKIMPYLIAELGLEPEEFYATEKVRPGKNLAKKEPSVIQPLKSEISPNPVPVAVSKPAASEVYIQGKTEVKVENKPIATPPPPKMKLSIDNYTEEGLVVALTEENGEFVLCIYPNCEESMKKACAEWIPPIDIIANGFSTVVRRKELTRIKKICKK